MKQKTVLILFFSIMLIFPLPRLSKAFERDLTRKGWYLGAGFTWAVHLFEDEVEDALLNLTDVNDTFGINSRFGYRLNKWISTEMQLEWLDGFDVNVLGETIFTMESFTWTVNGKFYYPVEQFQPYLLLGVGLSSYKVKDQIGIGENFDNATDFSGRLGIGFDVYFTNNWSIYVENSVVLSTADLGNITGQSSLSAIHYNSIQFGFQYRF